ncbi:MAG: glycosyltransferase family 1 protein [Cardiobacteriaceae bacterium]|nr:glycosyltransferase family 1 protein [Cardiobacteriaceae bacterium]
MKVLLLAPKNAPTYLNALYAAIRLQVGTCDLYSLDEKQSVNLEDFFRHFVRFPHYDRIVLMYDGDFIYQQGRFLRTLPNVSMLRLEYDPPDKRRKMKSNFHAMPWLRWIGSDINVAREYIVQGHDVFWIPQVYDPEHFYARPKRDKIVCHLFSAVGSIGEGLRTALQNIVELNVITSDDLRQSLSSGKVGREDLFVFLPDKNNYDPEPMIIAMACGAVVLTPDPGNEARMRYRWRNLHDCIFFNKLDVLPTLIGKVLSHPPRLANISHHALMRVKLFQPQVIGQRIGEHLEAAVRNPADYPKRQRIFGFEI